MSTPPKQMYAPEEYLALERAAQFRSEYHRGEMFAMSGGSLRHSRIATNLLSLLWAALRDKACSPFNSDLRIRVTPTGLYTYPDLSVVCGPPQFDDKHQDTVLNPTLIAEVLSSSTEAYDRGKKFDHYRQLPSLREYVLVSQDEPRLERLSRNPDDTWTLTIVTGVEQSLVFPSIGVTLALADIYDKVEFSDERLKASEMS